MAEPCTIFVLRIDDGARRLVLPAWSGGPAPTFEIETLEKDAAGGERWVRFEPRDKGPLIAMTLHHLLRGGGRGATIEVGRVTPQRNSINPTFDPPSEGARVDALLAARRDAAPRDADASASARMALDSPPAAASASVRMTLDTDTEANRKPRDIFDVKARDLLATRNAASARGEAVQSIEVLLADELRGRCRALKSVDELAAALAAACDEITAHNACAATLEGEYAVHRTPPERVAEWRKLAQEQA